MAVVNLLDQLSVKDKQVALVRQLVLSWRQKGQVIQIDADNKHSHIKKVKR